MLHFITWKDFNISLQFLYSSQLCDFPRKSVHADFRAFHAAFSVSHKMLGKPRSCITSHICGTIKIPSHSSLTQVWKLVPQMRESLSLYVQSFNKDIRQPYFNVHSGEISCGFTNGSQEMFVFPGVKVCC